MPWPRFARTLHFRITAIYVVLVVLVGGAYYAWIRATVYSPYDDEQEKWSLIDRLVTMAIERGKVAALHSYHDTYLVAEAARSD